MLGHSDTKMTRHYAKVLDKSIMRDMSVVNGKFASDTTNQYTLPVLQNPVLNPIFRSCMAN